jgi:hypothetical protein
MREPQQQVFGTPVDRFDPLACEHLRQTGIHWPAQPVIVDRQSQDRLTPQVGLETAPGGFDFR